MTDFTQFKTGNVNKNVQPLRNNKKKSLRKLIILIFLILKLKIFAEMSAHKFIMNSDVSHCTIAHSKISKLLMVLLCTQLNIQLLNQFKHSHMQLHIIPYISVYIVFYLWSLNNKYLSIFLETIIFIYEFQ